jgi:Ca2+-binding EF-hand superfamily protein
MRVFYCIAYREIKLFDLNDDGIVDIGDLVRVARRYRFTAGLPYDIEADVNADGQIDIGDLTTIAANIEG